MDDGKLALTRSIKDKQRVPFPMCRQLRLHRVPELPGRAADNRKAGSDWRCGCVCARVGVRLSVCVMRNCVIVDDLSNSAGNGLAPSNTRTYSIRVCVCVCVRVCVCVGGSELHACLIKIE